MQQLQEVLREQGYWILPSVYDSDQVAALLAEWTAAANTAPAAERIQRQGITYAARNVLQLWPRAAEVWRQPPLPEVLAAVLGPDFGLVRVLFFDKPPEQTWALPWHKDLTIAVREHRQPSEHFKHPTRKAGVPHVEAPVEVLEQMLTARIHLDPMTEENGPLKVIPGSHRRGTALSRGDELPCTILGPAGDVLLMRPLLEHSSGRSRQDTQDHRRVLHFEFAGCRELPEGYAWYQFLN